MKLRVQAINGETWYQWARHTFMNGNLHRQTLAR